MIEGTSEPGPGVDPAVAEPPNPCQIHIGWRMIEWNDERCVLELPLAPHHMNRYGIPQGGIYAMLLDTAMGYAGAYTGSAQNKRFTMTLSLTTNFLGRPNGTVLFASGRRVGGGSRTFFAEGSIRDEGDSLVATATGTFRFRSS